MCMTVQRDVILNTFFGLYAGVTHFDNICNWSELITPWLTNYGVLTKTLNPDNPAVHLQTFNPHLNIYLKAVVTKFA